MGIGVSQWRAVIGGWSGGRRAKFRRMCDTQRNQSVKIFSVVISILLVIGGIEVNPGPESASTFTLEDIMNKLMDIDKKLSNNIEMLSQKVNELTDQVFGINERLQETEGDFNQLKSRVSVQEAKIDYLENQSRRNNLVFYGLKQNGHETWEQTENLIAEVLSHYLNFNLDYMDIERAHRVGNGINRPIVVKFLSYKVKMDILKKSFMLKDSNIWINEDYSANIRQIRQQLLTFQRDARNKGHRATLRFDKLVVDDRIYNLSDLQNIAEEEAATKIPPPTGAISIVQPTKSPSPICTNLEAISEVRPIPQFRDSLRANNGKAPRAVPTSRARSTNERSQLIQSDSSGHFDDKTDDLLPSFFPLEGQRGKTSIKKPIRSNLCTGKDRGSTLRFPGIEPPEPNNRTTRRSTRQLCQVQMPN